MQNLQWAHWGSALPLAVPPAPRGFSCMVLLTLTEELVQITSAGIALSGIQPFAVCQE